MFKDLTFEKEWNEVWTIEEEHPLYTTYSLLTDQTYLNVHVLNRPHTSWIGRSTEGSIILLVENIVRDTGEEDSEEVRIFF